MYLPEHACRFVAQVGPDNERPHVLDMMIAMAAAYVTSDTAAQDSGPTIGCQVLLYAVLLCHCQAVRDAPGQNLAC